MFDNLFGYPGRSPMEQNGMGEKGFDATLDVVENGPAVKRLLQSTNNMDFAWGRMALQYLVHDGYAFDYAHFYDLDFLTTKMQELYK